MKHPSWVCRILHMHAFVGGIDHQIDILQYLKRSLLCYGMRFCLSCWFGSLSRHPHKHTFAVRNDCKPSSAEAKISSRSKSLTTRCNLSACRFSFIVPGFLRNSQYATGKWLTSWHRYPQKIITSRCGQNRWHAGESPTGSRAQAQHASLSACSHMWPFHKLLGWPAEAWISRSSGGLWGVPHRKPAKCMQGCQKNGLKNTRCPWTLSSIRQTRSAMSKEWIDFALNRLNWYCTHFVYKGRSCDMCIPSFWHFPPISIVHDESFQCKATSKQLCLELVSSNVT